MENEKGSLLVTTICLILVFACVIGIFTSIDRAGDLIDDVQSGQNDDVNGGDNSNQDNSGSNNGGNDGNTDTDNSVDFNDGVNYYVYEDLDFGYRTVGSRTTFFFAVENPMYHVVSPDGYYDTWKMYINKDKCVALAGYPLEIKYSKNLGVTWNNFDWNEDEDGNDMAYLLNLAKDDVVYVSYTFTTDQTKTQEILQRIIEDILSDRVESGDHMYSYYKNFPIHRQNIVKNDSGIVPVG